MKFDLKKSLRVPLTAYEQQIEDALPPAKTLSESKRIPEIRRAAVRLRQSMRGAVNRPAEG